MANSTGLNTKLCGTPDVHATSLEQLDPTPTYCVRPVRKDCSQSSATPSIPKPDDARSNSVEWTTVPNAADISRDKSTAATLITVLEVMYFRFCG